MLHKDYTTTLIGLKEVMVENIQEIMDKLLIHISLPRIEHQCPACGALTNKIHDYRIQNVMDISNFSKKILLFIRKRRYHTSVSTVIRKSKVISYSAPDVLPDVLSILEDVRKTEQKKFVDTKRRYFKNNRHVLLKASKKLSPEEHIILNRLLSNSPKLETAYYLKEYFFSIMYEKNKPSQLKMLEIWAALDTGYSNGYTEGCNNKIKVFKRVSYGFRNFGRFRNRFLHIAANPVSKC